MTLLTQAILLDIDGTLVDSNDKHADCWVEAFAHFDKDVAWDVIRQQIGKGGDLLVPDTLNAREMREFAADEIVYATMDTIRLVNYLRYEFGLAGGRRTTQGRRMTNDEGRFAPQRLETAEGRVVGLPADGI